MVVVHETCLESDRLTAVLLPLLGDRAEAFVAAGLAAVDGMAPSRSWVQCGVAVDPQHYRSFCAQLAEVARDMLASGAAANFFFMHKPPGLRVRFETSSALADQIAAALAHPGVTIEPGVYEPEEALFGGPSSMRFVHRVFTADAQAWLAFHQLATQTPNWAFSLALLRHLFNGLGISGWEDLEVWQRVQRQAFRVLPSGMEGDRTAKVTSAIRAAWADPQELRASLPPEAAALAAAAGEQLADLGGQWLQGYFQSHTTVIGPREAAAFATIFHWNRGRLSAVTQALIAAALADRASRP